MLCSLWYLGIPCQKKIQRMPLCLFEINKKKIKIKIVEPEFYLDHVQAIWGGEEGELFRHIVIIPEANTAFPEF